MKAQGAAESGMRRLTGWISARYILMIMGCLAFFCAYTMRICMNVAITEMAQAKHESFYDPDTCAGLDDEVTTNSTQQKPAEFDWNERVQGLVLGAFYYGYVVSQVPAGMFSDRYGGKYFLLGGILVRSVFAMLIPVAARTGGYGLVIFVRIVEGLAEGTTFPAASSMLARWAPPAERSKFGATVFTGNILGQLVGSALSGVIIQVSGDWSSVFYVFGGIGLLWSFCFYFLCFDSPNDHPRISESERTYINEAIAKSAVKRPEYIPWAAILTSGPVWAVIVAQLGHDWVLFTTGTELPKFMKSVLRYNVEANGLLSAVPNMATYASSMACGWLSDWLVSTGRISTNLHRKLFIMIANGLPTFFLLGACYAGCDRGLVITLFALGMGAMGPFSSSLKVNPLDLSPNYSGLLMALACGLGAISGIVSPYIVGEIIYDGYVREWRDVFWVTFGVCWVSNGVFVLFGSTTIQSWNSADNQKLALDGEKSERQDEKPRLPQSALDAPSVL